MTALIKSVRRGHFAIVELLLKSGANKEDLEPVMQGEGRRLYEHGFVVN